MTYLIFLGKAKNLASQLHYYYQLHGKQQKKRIYQQAPEIKSNL